MISRIFCGNAAQIAPFPPFGFHLSPLGAPIAVRRGKRCNLPTKSAKNRVGEAGGRLPGELEGHVSSPGGGGAGGKSTALSEKASPLPAPVAYQLIRGSCMWLVIVKNYQAFRLQSWRCYILLVVPNPLSACCQCGELQRDHGRNGGSEMTGWKNCTKGMST